MEGGMEGGWKDGEEHTQVRDPPFFLHFPSSSFVVSFSCLRERERECLCVCVWWWWPPFCLPHRGQMT